MVNVEQTRKLLIKNINTLKLVRKGLFEIIGLYFGKHYFSIDLPAFTSPAMDEYAVFTSAIQGKFPISLKIKG